MAEETVREAVERERVDGCGEPAAEAAVLEATALRPAVEALAAEVAGFAEAAAPDAPVRTTRPTPARGLEEIIVPCPARVATSRP